MAEDYRTKLVQEKERLEQLLQMQGFRHEHEHAVSDPAIPKGAADYDTRFPQLGQRNLADDEGADAVEEYENLLAQERALEDRLRGVMRALDRIEQGVYGKCELCKTDIDPERLDADPAAITCRKCMR